MVVVRIASFDRAWGFYTPRTLRSIDKQSLKDEFTELAKARGRMRRESGS